MVAREGAEGSAQAFVRLGGLGLAGLGLFTFISLKKEAVSPSIIGCSNGLLRLLEGDPCDRC